MLNDCTQEGCTVGTTGQCLLNNDAATCPHRAAAVGEPVLDDDDLLPEPEQNPTFRPSATLTEDSLSEVMASRYCTVIGIVGAPDSGKTAALVSMYLMLSHGRLAGFRYADSKSLMALDEISRGARRWTEGSPPDQMTAHTELNDDRAAGFLHLRVRRENDGHPVDFLLPDLPGEWSSDMVDESRHERLAFLERADVVWLMVDGRQLTTPATRQYSLHRTQVYLQRLKEFFPNLPKVVLVITRADVGKINEKTMASLMSEGVDLGINLTIKAIASFSENVDVPAGTGIADLIQASMGSFGEQTVELLPRSNRLASDRAIAAVVHGVVL